MKKQIILIALFLSFAFAGFSQWAQDSLPTARMLLQEVTFHDKVYFIGGETGQYPFYETAEVAIYDCLADTWIPSDSLSLGRSASACVRGDSGIYVVGGRIRNWTRLPSVWGIPYFDATNRIDIFKNGSWHTDSLPDCVWGGRALKLGSKLFFAGFVDSVNYLTSEIFASKKVYVFDESTGLWSTDSLSSARTEMGFATDGTLAIFAGGVNGLGVTSDVVDIYNSATGTWTTEHLSESRGFVGATFANGKFYFAGGVKSGVLNVCSDVIDIFDGASWSTDYLSVPRAGVMAVAINDEIFFMGGGEFDLSFLPYPNSATYNTVDVLNTSNGSWSRLDFNFPHVNQWNSSLTVWHLYGGFATWNNKIYVAGGGLRASTSSGEYIEYSPYVEIRDVTLGFADTRESISFDMYPNPSTGSSTLLLPDVRCEIQITDIFGHEVQKITTMDRQLEISLEESGVYLVRIQTRQGVAVRKLVISR